MQRNNRLDEMWNVILTPEYHGYAFSNLGNIKSLDRIIVNANGNKCKLKGKLLKGGELGVDISIANVSTFISTHIIQKLYHSESAIKLTDDVISDIANNPMYAHEQSYTDEELRYYYNTHMTMNGVYVNSIDRPWWLQSYVNSWFKDRKPQYKLLALLSLKRLEILRKNDPYTNCKSRYDKHICSFKYKPSEIRYNKANHVEVIDRINRHIKYSSIKIQAILNKLLELNNRYSLKYANEICHILDKECIGIHSIRRQSIIEKYNLPEFPPELVLDPVYDYTLHDYYNYKKYDTLNSFTHQ